MQEIVMMVGIPGSGKSEYSKLYTDKGYDRWNRDTEGGSIKNLVPKVINSIKAGKSVVVDNTHTNIEGRKLFIDVAKQYNISIKAYFFNTSKEDCQINVLNRMFKLTGKVILDNNEIKKLNHPNIFGIDVLFRFSKQLVEPSVSEGFSEVIRVDFKRKNMFPEYKNKALFLDYDGTIRITKSGNHYPTTSDDIQILSGRKEKLLEYKNKGYILCGISNQSGIAKGNLTVEDADKCFKETNKLLGIDIDYMFCPHSSHPISCYCRKPQSGLGIYFMHKYKLDLSNCLMIGDLTTDSSFAKRLGVKYIDANEFFN